LLPGEWNKPSLIFTLRNNSSSNNNPFTFQALEQAGLPMDSNDYQSLEIKLHDNSFAGFFHNLSGPLPTAKSRLANTQINQHDHSKIILRAGKCLMYLEQNSTFADSSILPFLNLQLNSQLWDVRDTLPGYGNADQVEVSAASLDSLLKASHAAPDSLLLKGLWRKLGTLLTEKREVQWCWEYFNALCSSEVVEVNQKMVQGLNWQDCELLWVVGNSALEMLEAELALEYAATCLMIDPSFANGYILQGLSYSQLQQWANAARAFRQASSRLLVPNPELLDAWTLAALNAPITQDWSKIYDLYVRHHPEQPINPKLLKQLNLGLLDGDLLRK